MTREHTYWVAFSAFPGIGPMRFRLLLDFFGSAQKAWNADAGDLHRINLGTKLIGEFLSFRKTFQLPQYIENLQILGIHAIPLDDPHYPGRLKEIPDAPFVLYVKVHPSKDKIDLLRTIAVVGTRKITAYGASVTKRLVKGLVEKGFTIVSGMAIGVDTLAHQTAIETGGKTVAVLGCGIDIIHPPSNARLYRLIGKQGYGAVVSEIPLGMRPEKGMFVARNRIISGLSMGVLVTEGAEDSGALLTARFAAEQGREVFAVPGPITSLYSRGPAQLIKKGATLVESVGDIIDELNYR